MALCFWIFALGFLVDGLRHPRLGRSVAVWILGALGVAAHPIGLVAAAATAVALLAVAALASDVPPRRALVTVFHVLVAVALAAVVWQPLAERLLHYGVHYGTTPVATSEMFRTLTQHSLPEATLQGAVYLGYLGLLAGVFSRRAAPTLTLYHGELDRRIARIVRAHSASPRVLVVGCGLEPEVVGAPSARWYGCDLDARAIAACRDRFPEQADRLEVCPGPFELPDQGSFARPFDVVLAKEVIEHLDEPLAWAQVLAARVAVGGALLLSTPNYGRWSTLALLERTVLEWIAKRDGYSRRHIHPSRFDRKRLAALDLGADFELVSVATAITGWTLLGHWRRRG